MSPKVMPDQAALERRGAELGDILLERGWRMATFALFRTAKALFPLMAERGGGRMIVTASTAAMRGNANQHAHAAAMAGRRLLCQSLNAEYGPKGIHITHVVVDGMVDAPDTVGLILGQDRFQQLREERGLEKDGLILPTQVAETYWHLAHQHRSTLSFELDLRAWSDKPWWNG